MRLLLITLTLTLSFAGSAQVPEQIPFQGRLLATNGQPTANGSYFLRVSLFDAITGGSQIWGPETHESVSVTDGVFSVAIGSVVPDLADAMTGPRFLQVEFSTDGLSYDVAGARQQLLSAPFAVVSSAVLGTSNRFPGDGRVYLGNANDGAFLEMTSNSTTFLFQSDTGFELRGGEPYIDFSADRANGDFDARISLDSGQSLRILGGGNSRFVAGIAFCFNGIVNIAETQPVSIHGAASCTNYTGVPSSPAASANCPAGTTRVTIWRHTANGQGGEAAICLR